MYFGGPPCDSRAEVAPRLQFRACERAMSRRGIAGWYSGIYVLPRRLSLKGERQWSTDLSGGVCVPEGRGDLRVGTVGTDPRGRRQSGRSARTPNDGGGKKKGGTPGGMEEEICEKGSNHVL